jgi:hypothetical protein
LRHFLYHGQSLGGAGGEELSEGLHAGQERVDGANDVNDLRDRDSSAFSEVVNGRDDGLGPGKLASPRGFRNDFHHELSSVTGRFLQALFVDTEEFKLLIGISVDFGKTGFALFFEISVGLLLSKNLCCFLLGKPELQFSGKAI